MMRLLEHPLGRPPTGAPEIDHAQRLLAAHGLAVRRVVAVDVDSVLYVAHDGTARTAWLTPHAAAVTIHDVAGFAIERPAPAAPPLDAGATADRASPR